MFEIGTEIVFDILHAIGHSVLAMQAITTSFKPHTTYKPSRLIARCSRGKSLILSWDSLESQNLEDKHREAARKLCDAFVQEDFDKRGEPKEGNTWGRPFVTGTNHKEEYVHVFLS